MPEDQQTFMEWLTQERTDRPFDKDSQLIKQRLRRVAFEFESGVGVQIPPDALNDQVTVSDMDDGMTRLEVQDKLKDLRGR